MNWINPPESPPAHVSHHTFYSKLLGFEIGYNIYLPPNCAHCPVRYHLHGFTGHESTEIWPMEPVYRGTQTIMVFPNVTSGGVGYVNGEFPMEDVILTELIPHIDAHYPTDPNPKSRSLSGFSMGGGGAFYYAAKHPELFGAVTAYAGTYHHFFYKGSRTVDVPPEHAAELLDEMLQREASGDQLEYLGDNILGILRENAAAIRGELSIALHVGSADILRCDNEIMHLYLNSLHIPHEYRVFSGAAHELTKIL